MVSRIRDETTLQSRPAIANLRQKNARKSFVETETEGGGGGGGGTGIFTGIRQEFNHDERRDRFIVNPRLLFLSVVIVVLFFGFFVVGFVFLALDAVDT